MTGPEHYRMAESLVKVADEGSVDWESTLAAAQVHATLALAAATAMSDMGLNPVTADEEDWLSAVRPATEAQA